ncbi:MULTISPECIES: 1-acyl-sn-glycerol-3-phosphate acyltransferase [Gammaproteobacteria]|uniref:1-acyl-sn-glycerol-3-phosphate acyltransferase n=1 Tax=Gammaproteobacteria TaxID=1236 RepID=UPI000DD01E7C|nr:MULTISPECIES: 1-acyl-sn-glycerol-3-phosphate acyltransferase [Gammaproteobacteria]RTE85562.1 acyltransferase [Aliidiomarina sp. B3213]TCZ89532.1 acyltransferase [Lysobacter sp. N42]
MQSEKQWQHLPVRNGRFGRWFGRLGLRCLGGWKITGELPDIPKAVIAVAPHTSNWDFFVGIFAMFALRLKISFLGKHSIFVFPVKRLLMAMGGIPVNRGSAKGVVGEMVAAFNEREHLLLGLSPEGTRSKVEEWKKGFLYMARDAKVPVIPVALCFQSREIQIGEPIHIEDIDVGLAAVKAFTGQAQGKRPELA